jgi:hypothetical protein
MVREPKKPELPEHNGTTTTPNPNKTENATFPEVK